MDELPQVIGVLAEEDLHLLPEPMLEAYSILRRIAHCGMPHCKADGTALVFIALREEGYHPMSVTIGLDGRMKFKVRQWEINA